MDGKNILIPLTDTAGLRATLPNMLDWLEKLKGGVTVNMLYIIDPHNLDAGTPIAEEMRIKKIQLRELAVKFEEHGINANYTVKLGSFVDEVVREAKETGAFSVLMCTNGRGWLSRIASGFAVERIINRTSCPVIIFKSGLLRFTDKVVHGVTSRVKKLTPDVAVERV
jgi:nucleotide-binding universal stress UspA family protein